MINYKWAMFNSYVKLPEGTQQKHRQTVIFINQLSQGVLNGPILIKCSGYLESIQS